MKSLQKLALKTGSPSTRFWGKIYGLEKDYLIAEGTLEGGGGEEEGQEKPADMEARGAGVNKYVYWATSSPLADWVQLPDLRPKDVKIARSIKMLFTGNLDSKIVTNPFFFDTEKLYLRAQIARISLSTSLVPKGLYKKNEENDKEIEDN